MTITNINGRCTLVNDDAFNFMARLPDKFVDITIMDSPFSEHTHKNLGREQRSDGHGEREALSFAHFSDDHIRAAAQATTRITKRWIAAFTDDRSISTWGHAFETAGARWVRTGSWVKTSPMPQMTGDRPGSGEEFIVIAYAGSDKLSWNGGGRSGVFRGPRDQKPYHETLKPVWMMQELAMLFATPGALVFDPFMGSGSTGVGAVFPSRVDGLSECANVGCPKCQKALTKYMDNRPELIPDLKFLGIERDPQTFVTATRRMEAAFRGEHYDPEQQTDLGQ